MRPTISKLLVPTIYEDLEDHYSVLDHPNIRGVSKNLFFITHNENELSVCYQLCGISKISTLKSFLSLAVAKCR